MNATVLAPTGAQGNFSRSLQKPSPRGAGRPKQMADRTLKCAASREYNLNQLLRRLIKEHALVFLPDAKAAELRPRKRGRK